MHTCGLRGAYIAVLVHELKLDMQTIETALATGYPSADYAPAIIRAILDASPAQRCNGALRAVGTRRNMMKYKLVIFDFDGTLADSFPWFLSVINTVAERYRFKRVDEHEGATMRRYSARQIVQHLEVPWWKLPFIARHACALAKRDRAQIALFPGVDHLLAQLAETGITLAVVSSNSEETVRHALGAENAARITWVALWETHARSPYPQTQWRTAP